MCDVVSAAKFVRGTQDLAQSMQESVRSFPATCVIRNRGAAWAAALGVLCVSTGLAPASYIVESAGPALMSQRHGTPDVSGEHSFPDPVAPQAAGDVGPASAAVFIITRGSVNASETQPDMSAFMSGTSGNTVALTDGAPQLDSVISVALSPFVPSQRVAGASESKSLKAPQFLASSASDGPMTLDQIADRVTW